MIQQPDQGAAADTIYQKILNQYIMDITIARSLNSLFINRTVCGKKCYHVIPDAAGNVLNNDIMAAFQQIDTVLIRDIGRARKMNIGNPAV